MSASSSSFRARAILTHFLVDGTLHSLPFPTDLEDHPRGLLSQCLLSSGTSSVTQSCVALQKCRKLCYGFLGRLLFLSSPEFFMLLFVPQSPSVLFPKSVPKVWLYPSDGHTLFCKRKSGPSFLLLSPHLLHLQACLGSLMQLFSTA